MSDKEKVGIYGGTFSPIHCGHVKAALAFLHEMSLDKLFIVPTSLSCRKVGLVGAADVDRLAMARLAFAELDERICVSDIEIAHDTKSYTADTLRRFAAPSRQLYMLVGTDMFLILDKWYRAKEIFALAQIVLMQRECDGDNAVLIGKKIAEYREKYAANISVIDDVPIVVSSTQIRERISKGELFDELVPDSVKRYINDNNLYR